MKVFWQTGKIHYEGKVDHKAGLILTDKEPDWIFKIIDLILDFKYDEYDKLTITVDGKELDVIHLTEVLK